MEKEQAEKALQIIRQVIENTRDDLIDRNWGLIWMVHAFTNSAAFAAIGLFAEQQGRPIFWYLVPLAAVAVVNLAIVVVLADRDRGVRSPIEWQLHGIWTTFIVFTLALCDKPERCVDLLVVPDAKFTCSRFLERQLSTLPPDPAQD